MAKKSKGVQKSKTGSSVKGGRSANPAATAVESERLNWSAVGMLHELQGIVIAAMNSVPLSLKYELFQKIAAQLRLCRLDLNALAVHYAPPAKRKGEGPDCPRGYHADGDACLLDEP